MTDLYDRIVEVSEVTRALGGDVDRLRTALGPRSIQDAPSAAEYGARRAYVRAIFALVEAIVEQHKRLLLDLDGLGTITLERATWVALREQAYEVGDNGGVSARQQFLQLRRKLRLVYRTAGEAFAEPLVVRYDDQGWQRFGEALTIRDRITHPKSSSDCYIEGDDLDTLDRGHDWFRGLSNEFVRVAKTTVGRASSDKAAQPGVAPDGRA